MFYTKVKEVPKRSKNDLRGCLEEFMSENTKCAKVHINDDGHYCSMYSARSALNKSALFGGLPIDVKIIDGQIYLIRRDI